MKFSRNPGTFLLLRLNQPAAHTGKCLFGKLALGNIYARPDVAGKGTIRIEPRYANIDNPSICSVVAAEPILHPETFSAIEGTHVDIQAFLQIVGGNTVRPAVSKLRLQ